MAVDVFGREEFEAALSAALKDKDLQWIEVPVRGGELHYQVPLQAFNEIDNYVAVEINSSIDWRSGLSADTGENSIRAWIADADGSPLGNKVQKWVTRVSGWETRLADVLDKLIKMAQQINLCPTCGKIEKVFVVKKEGANRGRIFKKCCDVFVWLDEVTDKTPKCPDCGHLMVQRESQYGKFWGCRQYPICKGTRKLDWEKKEKKDDSYWNQLTKEHVDAKEEPKKSLKKTKVALSDKLKSVLHPWKVRKSNVSVYYYRFWH